MCILPGAGRKADFSKMHASLTQYKKRKKKKKPRRDVQIMVAWQDPELTHSHRHTKPTATYGSFPSEKEPRKKGKYSLITANIY